MNRHERLLALIELRRELDERMHLIVEEIGRTQPDIDSLEELERYEPAARRGSPEAVRIVKARCAEWALTYKTKWERGRECVSLESNQGEVISTPRTSETAFVVVDQGR